MSDMNVSRNSLVKAAYVLAQGGVKTSVAVARRALNESTVNATQGRTLKGIPLPSDPRVAGVFQQQLQTR